jgi:hypothetical protein
MISRILPLALLSGLGLYADDTLVSGPLMGLVSTSTGIRPIVGMPGAAYVGPAILLDIMPTAVYTAPEGAFALLTTAQGVRILHASNGKTVLREVTAAIEFNAAWFSPSGRSALLVSADGLNAQLLTGLPAQPSISAVFVMSDPLSIAAVSEDGRRILTGSKEGALLQWDGDGTLRGAVSISGISAMQFFNQSNDALVASRTDKMLYRLNQAGETVPLHGMKAIAIASSTDDSMFYAVLADGSLQTMNANGDPMLVIRPPLAATKLRRMGGVLALIDSDNGPLEVFDGTQVLLIPPAKDGGAQ